MFELDIFGYNRNLTKVPIKLYTLSIPYNRQKLKYGQYKSELSRCCPPLPL